MPPISCTKSNTRSAHEDSPLSKTVSSSFLGPSLCITDQDWGRDFFGWHQPHWRVSFMPSISCTKSNTWSAHKDSPLSKTVLSSFLRTKSLHQRSRLRKRYFGWHQPPERPPLCLPSLVQSQTPDQHLKTVQYPKQFGYSCIFFRSFSWT